MDWLSALAAIKDYQTLLAAIVACMGGFWALNTHLRRREHDARIQFRVTVRLVGHHDRHWVAEILAVVENRGQVPHRMNGLSVNLKGIRGHDNFHPTATRTDGNGRLLEPVPVFAGQLHFPVRLVPTEGEMISMLPPSPDSRVHVYPGTSMRYMYVTSVPEDLRFLIVHGVLTLPKAEPLRADRVVPVRLPPSSSSDRIAV